MKIAVVVACAMLVLTGINFIPNSTVASKRKLLYIANDKAYAKNILIDFIRLQPDNPDNFANNVLSDDNFFSQVWHKTLGGTLPFIFQPDNSNNNPDNFAICRFVDNSLKATQTAPHVYDISLKIEEVW